MGEPSVCKEAHRVEADSFPCPPTLSRTWCRISVGLSMPANAEQKEKEEQSRHMTGSFTSMSSRREVFAER